MVFCGFTASTYIKLLLFPQNCYLRLLPVLNSTPSPQFLIITLYNFNANILYTQLICSLVHFYLVSFICTFIFTSVDMLEVTS